jgi:hypothetical protein
MDLEVRYLPDVAFSDCAEGKDQIIYASAATSVLAPVILAATLVGAVKAAWRALLGIASR